MIEATLSLPRRDFALDVALRLPGQGVSALFGPSGCGKTTVLRALAGLERAAGRVAVNGEVWQDDEARRFVPAHRRPLGYVIQEAALFPHLSVADNLAYGRRRSAAAGAALAAQQAVVELLGIGPLMARRPQALSGGERQRVAIARALATEPAILLMDEPLAALDAGRKAEILPYLERLQRHRAIPIVYVTHAMDEVTRLADHLVLLQGGRVAAAGPLEQVLARPDAPLGPRVPGHDEAGVVIRAQLRAHDDAYQLSEIGFAQGHLWLGRVPAQPGDAVRVRVLARDVSLVREPPRESSILNVLPVTVAELQSDAATAMVGLVTGHGALPGGGVRLLSRITRKSCELLALQPGDQLYAQVKGVSLM